MGKGGNSREAALPRNLSSSASSDVPSDPLEIRIVSIMTINCDTNEILSPARTKRFAVGNTRVAVIAAILFALGISATLWRTVHQYQPPGAFDQKQHGLCDFHNGLYFPAMALVHGISPYGFEYVDQYPVASQIPFFLPSFLLLHAPLSMLPLLVAEVAYFSFTVILILVISGLLAHLLAKNQSDEAPLNQVLRLDHLLTIAAVILFSRGGHITLFNGYFTFELILATFVAIHFGNKKPFLAALALALIASKPNCILPLGFLLLARGNVKAVLGGAVITIVAAGIPTLWLAYNEGGGDIVAGLETLQQQIEQTQEIHRSHKSESPVHSWTRIDLLAIVAKWTGNDPQELTHLVVMGFILAPVLWLLDKRRRWGVDDGLLGMTGALILTTTLVSVYHQSYDVSLLMAPLAGIVCGVPSKTWYGKFSWARWSAAALMLVPLYNYLSTRAALEAFGWGLEGEAVMGARVFTSISGIALVVLLVLLGCLAVRPSQPSKPSMASKAPSG